MSQTCRILIAGMSGGGKSYFGKQVVSKFIRERRYHQVVIVNRKNEFHNFAEKSFIVNESADPATALRKYSRVFFRVDGKNPYAFLSKLGYEILKRENVLLVVDEAFEFLPRGQVAPELFQVITRGRSLGHNCVFMTQMLQSQQGGIDLAVLQQCTHMALLRLQGENDVKRVESFFPELGAKVLKLARPDNGLPPEIAMKNLMTSECGVLARSKANPRVRTWYDLSQHRNATFLD